MPKAKRTARHVGNFYQETLTKFAFLLFIMSYKICTVENICNHTSVNYIINIDFKIYQLDNVLTLFVHYLYVLLCMSFFNPFLCSLAIWMLIGQYYDWLETVWVLSVPYFHPNWKYFKCCCNTVLTPLHFYVILISSFVGIEFQFRERENFAVLHLTRAGSV